MNPKRPYIPIAVRIAVAERQVAEMCFRSPELATMIGRGMSDRYRLKALLGIVGRGLAGGELQLDHDPALGRRKRNKRTGRYTPDANDPRYLVYREKSDHLDKTAGRGGDKMRFGGDTRAIAKVRRIEREGKFKTTLGLKPHFTSRVNKSTAKMKRKIAGRGFGKQHRPLRGGPARSRSAGK